MCYNCLNFNINGGYMLLEDFIDYNGQKVIFITGSGISEASGVPTFRGTNGLWLNNDIEEICNIKNFDKYYDKIIPFYDHLRLSLSDKKYNDAHSFIADMQKKYGSHRIGVATTNVDLFHEEAGACNVHHIHGNITELIVNYKQPNEHCINIGYKPFNYDSLTAKCKPNVIFFEEAMHYEEGFKKEIYSDLLWLISHARKNVIIFIIGASNQVIPFNVWLNGCSATYYNVNPVSYNKENNPIFRFPHEIEKNAIDAISDMKLIINNHMSI